MYRQIIRPRVVPVIAAILSLAVGACTDPERSLGLTGPETPETGLIAFMKVTALSDTGLEVSINALRAADEQSIGSYTLRVAYDTVGLVFIDAKRNDQGLILANAVDGQVIIAGASGAGFTGSELATLRMVVRDRAALASLKLTVTEITTTDFAVRAKATIVDGRLFRGDKQ